MVEAGRTGYLDTVLYWQTALMAERGREPITVEVAEGGQPLIDGSAIATPYPVRDAVVATGLAIVLYDPNANPRSWGTFRNLAALTSDGQQIWLAETSTTYTGDCWEEFVSSEPLVVVSWQGFRCEFDPATGRILERTFIH